MQDYLGKYLCSFPWAPITTFHKPGGLELQKFIVPQSEGQKSEIKVSAGPHSLQGLQGKSFHISSSVWQTQPSLGVWSHNSNLCFCLHLTVFPLCLPNFSSSKGQQCPVKLRTHLKSITSAKSQLLNKVTVTNIRGQNFHLSLEGKQLKL